MKTNRPSIWICLSGGGFRAALFHYGCLKRLHEVGLLGHVYAFSATSGGAIVASLLAKHQGGSHSDSGAGLYDYDWNAFEHAFLSLVRRGVLTPTALLVTSYLLYAVALPLLWLDSYRGALACVVCGLILHGILASLLIRERVYAPSIEAIRWATMDKAFEGANWAHKSFRRLVRMLFQPAFLRWQTLNFRAFEGCLLPTLRSGPLLFVTAVDINTGKEVVFTAGAVTTLGAIGCKELWLQRSESSRTTSKNVEIAQAVSASTAIPPWFRPVRINVGDDPSGVFVDGGVVDNFAMNVPKALSVHTHERGYARGAFVARTSLIVMLDGSGPVSAPRWRFASRVPAALRLLDILFNQQMDDLNVNAFNFSTLLKVETVGVTLRLGFPESSKLDELCEAVSRIRTNLDSFTLEECATLAYSGYLWIEELVKGGAVLDGYPATKWAPPRSLSEVLPASVGQWDSNVAALRRHLRYSGRRLWLTRVVGRRLGI